MADGDVSAQDLLKRLDKYHDKLIKLTEKTEAEVNTLRAAVDAVSSQKESNWRKYKPIIMLVLYVAAFLIVLFGARQLGYCSISIKSITEGGAQRCEQKTIQTSH